MVAIRLDRRLAARVDPSDIVQEALAALRKEKRQRVRDLLDRLPAGDREVLVLRFLERLSTSEAAEVLGISSGAVRLRLMRALERLRVNLGDISLGEDVP